MKRGKVCAVSRDFIQYAFSQKGLTHLQTYCHYGLKLKHCRYGKYCKAYVRLVNHGTRLDDRWHVMVYTHPPRRNQGYDELDDKTHPFAGKTSIQVDVSDDNIDEKDERNMSKIGIIRNNMHVMYPGFRNLVRLKKKSFLPEYKTVINH
eukprot:271151_1